MAIGAIEEPSRALRLGCVLGDLANNLRMRQLGAATMEGVRKGQRVVDS